MRDTAAWTFGRICEIIPEAAINETFLKPLLESLITGLKAEPRVAANVCWAFTGLQLNYKLYFFCKKTVILLLIDYFSIFLINRKID